MSKETLDGYKLIKIYATFIVEDNNSSKEQPIQICHNLRRLKLP